MLADTHRSFLHIRNTLLTGLIVLITKAGNSPAEEVKWHNDGECRIQNDRTNLKESETDVTWGHRTHVTEPLRLGETGGLWSRHKLARTGTHTRKKWSNYSATKKTVTTIHILAEQRRLIKETELRENGRDKRIQAGPPETLITELLIRKDLGLAHL
eukprot:944273-Prorocentrum_minimum.AAC.1